MRYGNNPALSFGFTLFELIVVLAIITAMVAVVLPFCKRSNDSLKIRQHSSNVAQTIRYAIDLAENRNKVVKFILNEKRKSYYLRIEDQNSFKPLNDFIGMEKFIDESINLYDISGFEQMGTEYFLAFDPQKTWPNAGLSLSANDIIEIITIASKHVEIEENHI